MTLLERNQGILDRIKRIDRIAPRIEQVLVAGKLDQLARGLDAQGDRFTPLAASTLRYRRSSAPPLGGADTQLARSYRVTVEPHAQGLKITGRFGVDYARYLRAGTRKMPKRDPFGFRRQDVAEVVEIVKTEIMRDGR